MSMLPLYPISHKTIDIVSYYRTHRKFCLVLMRDFLICMQMRPKPVMERLTIVKNVMLSIVEEDVNPPECDCLSKEEDAEFMKLIHFLLKFCSAEYTDEDKADDTFMYKLAIAYAAITMHIDDHKIEMPDYFEQFYQV